MTPRIAIVYYSLFGHCRQLAEAEKRGVEAAGGIADLWQIAEILPDDVLVKIGAPPPDPAVPVAQPSDLLRYDGLLIGIPTRFGALPTTWSIFWDAAQREWEAGMFHGMPVSAFISVSNLGAGMETTILNFLPTVAHFGMVFVPSGGINGHLLGTLKDVTGGSPWGAGCYNGADGSRNPTKGEIEIAERQGNHFTRALVTE